MRLTFLVCVQGGKGFSESQESLLDAAGDKRNATELRAPTLLGRYSQGIAGMAERLSSQLIQTQENIITFKNVYDQS